MQSSEMFEWEDGNPSSEDRIGCTVVVDSGKIRIAQKNEIPIGVITLRPHLSGQQLEQHWHGKYVHDDFGRPVMEETKTTSVVYLDPTTKLTETKHLTDEELEEFPFQIQTKMGSRTEKRPKINPQFDPNKKYRPRSLRKEWDNVLLFGRGRVKSFQTINNGWLPLQPISSSVREYLILPSFPYVPKPDLDFTSIESSNENIDRYVDNIRFTLVNRNDVYAEKADEAIDFKVDMVKDNEDLSSYPYIQAQHRQTKVSPNEIADEILSHRNIAVNLNAELEGIRIGTKHRAMALDNERERKVLYRAMKKQITQLLKNYGY